MRPTEALKVYKTACEKLDSRYQWTRKQAKAAVREALLHHLPKRCKNEVQP
jgi:hypothetical protein